MTVLTGKEPKLSITAAAGTEILHVQVMSVYRAPMLHLPTLVNRKVVEAATLRFKEALDEVPAAVPDVDGVAKTETILVAKATWPGTSATLPPSRAGPLAPKHAEFFLHNGLLLQNCPDVARLSLDLLLDLGLRRPELTDILFNHPVLLGQDNIR